MKIYRNGLKKLKAGLSGMEGFTGVAGGCLLFAF